MKKYLVSAGLVAVGATGLQAAYAPGLSRMQTTKPWSVSASLRGFYDDNMFLAPSSSEEDSFGFEISPSIALNFPREQTYIGLQYVYTAKYYDAREENKTDETHEFIARLAHKFSERYKLNFEDSFIYSQEPEVITEVGQAQVLERTDSDVVRNRADIDFTARLTELLELEFGYQNTWYDYSQDFNDVGFGSRSALLDRVEHLMHVDGRWLVRPNLIGIVGYQYGIFKYTSDDPIDSSGLPGDVRDNTSHYGYVGADYSVTSQLSASGRVGLQYTDYSELSETDLTPYFLLVGTYTYLPGSYVQFGARHDRNATDIADFNNTGSGSITLDVISTTAFASVNHRITPQVTGSLVGQFQVSTFNGGDVDDNTDNFYILGLNLEYQFNRNWSAETGYNFDRLDSDLSGRSFSRNRVYLGVRATY